MKLQTRQIDAFLQKPTSSIRAVLLYGPDRGLIKARAQQLTDTLKIDRNDPFSSVLLDGSVLAEDPGRLEREAATISLMGGLRFVGVRAADDTITPALKSYLDGVTGADSFVICEAGELSPRSPLRLLCERAENAVALPCYVEEERDLTKWVGESLRGRGFAIDRDALAVFCSVVTGDRGQVAQEVEKLMLYMGTEMTIREDDVVYSLGRAGAPTLDALGDAYGLGDGMRAVDLATALLAEGQNSIALVRALLNHLRRIHRCKSEMAKGAPIETALDALNPKVFFKRETSFRQQVHRLRFDDLNRMLGALMDIEFRAKQTGEPDILMLKQHLLQQS